MNERFRKSSMQLFLVVALLLLLTGCGAIQELVQEVPLPLDLIFGTATPVPPLPTTLVERIAALPDAPLESTPIKLREEAALLLRSVPSPSSGAPALTLGLVDRLQADAGYFLDDFRFEEKAVLLHDFELIDHLLGLARHPLSDPGSVNTISDALIKLLMADRLVISAVARDTEVIVSSIETLGEEIISPIAVQAAATELDRVRLGLENAISSWRGGNALQGLNSLIQSWEAADAARTAVSLPYDGDKDADGVLDLVELGYGASPFLLDSDRDGLDDLYEVENTVPYTSPGLADTDGDGTLDGDEDIDFDGLTNLMELDLGTHPRLLDSDGDGIGDQVLLLGENMGETTGDSDGDGLSDESEERLGTDPLHVDSDRDSIPDSQEFHLQILSLEERGITVELYGMGDQSDAFQFEPMVGAPGFAGQIGSVGDFVNLRTSLPIQRAKIRFRYDVERVPGRDVANLRMFLYDEALGNMVLLVNQVVDVQANQVVAETNRLGPIGILYLPIWQAVVPEFPVMEFE
jgi:hypothetical protein